MTNLWCIAICNFNMTVIIHPSYTFFMANLLHVCTILTLFTFVRLQINNVTAHFTAVLAYEYNIVMIFNRNSASWPPLLHAGRPSRFADCSKLVYGGANLRHLRPGISVARRTQRVTAFSNWLLGSRGSKLTSGVSRGTTPDGSSGVQLKAIFTLRFRCCIFLPHPNLMNVIPYH